MSNSTSSPPFYKYFSADWNWNNKKGPFNDRMWITVVLKILYSYNVYNCDLRPSDLFHAVKSYSKIRAYFQFHKNFFWKPLKLCPFASWTWNGKLKFPEVLKPIFFLPQSPFTRNVQNPWRLEILSKNYLSFCVKIVELQ